MKILLIGNFEGGLDEGAAQLSRRFSRQLARRFDVRTINTSDVVKPRAFSSAIRFQPDIIHYLSGPTIRSFIVLSAMKRLIGNGVRSVVSATRPYLNQADRKRIRFFRPDLVLTQAEKWRTLFEDAGINCSFLPNPIQTDRFNPAGGDIALLRGKYSLPMDKRIILHVGHIRPNRNLEVLAELQEHFRGKSSQVVLVGSTRYPADAQLLDRLESAGCIVINRFLQNIADIYHCADVYLFPVCGLERSTYPEGYNSVGVIDMPLSILEALCCGVPVVSTEVDAIQTLLRHSGPSPIHYYDGTLDGCIGALAEAGKNTGLDMHPITESVADQRLYARLETIYHRLGRDEPVGEYQVPEPQEDPH